MIVKTMYMYIFCKIYDKLYEIVEKSLISKKFRMNSPILRTPFYKLNSNIAHLLVKVIMPQDSEAYYDLVTSPR